MKEFLQSCVSPLTEELETATRIYCFIPVPA